MAHRYALEFAAKTDTGLVRSHNEDSVAISTAFRFAILADGMGGYRAGEVASGIATSVMKNVLEEGLQRQEPRRQNDGQIHRLMNDAVQRANTAILEAAGAEPRYEGMGTTLVAALFHADKVTIAHVGDSRAYRMRGERLEQITRDHSLLQEQIDAGLISPESAHFSPNKNLVTRAVGVAPDMEVELHDHQAEAGDLYLLCSDGLSDMLTESEIREILIGCGPSLDFICNELVRKANEHGGRDNVSVILVQLGSGEREAHGLLARVLRWIS